MSDISNASSLDGFSSRADLLAQALKEHPSADPTQGGTRFITVKNSSGESKNSVTKSIKLRDVTTDSTFVISISITALGVASKNADGKIVSYADTDHDDVLERFGSVLGKFIKGIHDKF